MYPERNVLSGIEAAYQMRTVSKVAMPIERLLPTRSGPSVALLRQSVKETTSVSKRSLKKLSSDYVK